MRDHIGVSWFELCSCCSSGTKHEWRTRKDMALKIWNGVLYEYWTKSVETIRLKRIAPTTYHPTHSRTLPPPEQVISTETKNILVRHFYKHAEEKLRPKRAASDVQGPDNVSRHRRASAT